MTANLKKSNSLLNWVTRVTQSEFKQSLFGKRDLNVVGI